MMLDSASSAKKIKNENKIELGLYLRLLEGKLVIFNSC